MSQDSRADATKAPQETQQNNDVSAPAAEQNAQAATQNKTATTDTEQGTDTANQTASSAQADANMNAHNPTAEGDDADSDTPMPPKEPIPAPARWSPKKKSIWGLGFFIALILIGIALILYAWQLPPFTSHVQQTDNAFIKGKTTIISPQVSGYVDSVMVQDFDVVKAGDVLVKIDDRSFTQQLEQAEANIEVATTNRASNAQDTESSRAQIEARQADLYSAQVSVQSAAEDVNRYEGLDAIGAVSKAEVAHTKAQLAKARAAVQQAEANLQAAREAKDKTRGSRASLDANIKNAEAAAKQAKINLDNTVITAPESGQLSQVSVKAGQFVNAGTQLMYIVPKGVWVIANFKETQVTEMRIGMPATVRVDALGGAEFTGHISNISPATGSEFSAGASNPATGNYIKITQRIPVRIDLDPDQPQLTQMRPGMSVAASVDTRAK